MARTATYSLTGVAAALVLSACGSNDEITNPAPSTSPTTSVPVTTTAVATTQVTQTTASTVLASEPTVLVDFPDADSVDGWSIQNDTVMGGVSNSRTEWLDGRLIFAGDVSLDNNGGFCSMRSPVSTDYGAIAEGATALTLTATGDDQTYVIQVRTDRDLFVSRVTIASGAEDTYVLPFADFTATDFMLDAITPLEPLDPASILQIAVYILDKQEGAFRLAIRSFGVV
ncbi:MAG: CIA30 family protein [Acidimicrobiales bacterium mtb01]|nr:CIA30 family protein [Actinomycetota bacterium]TEX47924.1 MAG: CIA30 family protein [Acidimicrobiales bacterium mtb01]